MKPYRIIRTFKQTGSVLKTVVLLGINRLTVCLWLAKLRILTILFFGSFQMLAIRDTILLIIISLLFGVIIELVLRKLKFLKNKGSLHIAFGARIISFVAVGCAACGLSFGSIIGLAWVLTLLPFHGLELYVLSIVILLVSIFYNVHAYVKACNLS